MKNVLKIAAIGITALALGLSFARVGAQTRYDFAGTYNVSGSNPDGSTYSDIVIVTDYGDGYRANYGDGETGIASDFGTSIAIASENRGVPTVTILKIVNASQLTGFWQEYTNNKEGQETWTER